MPSLARDSAGARGWPLLAATLALAAHLPAQDPDTRTYRGMTLAEWDQLPDPTGPQPEQRIEKLYALASLAQTDAERAALATRLGRLLGAHGIRDAARAMAMLGAPGHAALLQMAKSGTPPHLLAPGLLMGGPAEVRFLLEQRFWHRFCRSGDAGTARVLAGLIRECADPKMLARYLYALVNVPDRAAVRRALERLTDPRAAPLPEASAAAVAAARREFEQRQASRTAIATRVAHGLTTAMLDALVAKIRARPDHTDVGFWSRDQDVALLLRRAGGHRPALDLIRTMWNALPEPERITHGGRLARCLTDGSPQSTAILIEQLRAERGQETDLTLLEALQNDTSQRARSVLLTYRHEIEERAARRDVHRKVDGDPACRLLGAMDARGLATLQHLLLHEDARIRDAARAGLAIASRNSEAARATLLDELRAWAARGDQPPASLVDALAHAGSWAAPTLARMLRGGNARLRDAILSVFERMGDGAIIVAPEIGFLLTRDDWQRERALAVVVGMKEHALPALPMLERALRKAEEVPVAEVNLLRKLAPFHLYWFVRVTARCSSKVRDQLLDIVARTNPLPRQQEKKPLHLLRSESPQVRLALLAAMERAGDVAAEDLPELVQALDDAHWEVRARALDAIARLGRDAAPAVAALRARTGDRDGYVRQRARAALAAAGS